MTFCVERICAFLWNSTQVCTSKAFLRLTCESMIRNWNANISIAELNRTNISLQHFPKNKIDVGPFCFEIEEDFRQLLHIMGKGFGYREPHCHTPRYGFQLDMLDVLKQFFLWAMFAAAGDPFLLGTGHGSQMYTLLIKKYLIKGLENHEKWPKHIWDRRSEIMVYIVDIWSFSQTYLS